MAENENPYIQGHKVDGYWYGPSGSKIGTEEESNMGQFFGDLYETFGSKNSASKAGKQRAEAELDRQFNANEAEKQRQWETQMSNTSLQRKMADAQAAGLNPIFALDSQGASTPAGASASHSGGSGSQDTGYASGFLKVASIAAALISSGARMATASKVAGEKIASDTAMKAASINARKEIANNYISGAAARSAASDKVRQDIASKYNSSMLKMNSARIAASEARQREQFAQQVALRADANAHPDDKDIMGDRIPHWRHFASKVDEMYRNKDKKK